MPQNSVRGLVFDKHGFLWMATEGGIARFDGENFRVMNTEDHAPLKNQRFSHAMAISDTSILFIDLLNGMYLLSNDHFTTIQQPDIKNPDITRINGSPPDARFLIQDSFYQAENKRAKLTGQMSFNILPATNHKVFMVSDRIVLADNQLKTLQIIQQKRLPRDLVVLLHDDLLKLDSTNQLYILQSSNGAFEKCTLQDENGQPWQAPSNNTRVFSQYPFEDVFMTDGKKLYKLLPTGDRRKYIFRTILDRLPEHCTIRAIAYRKADDLLVLGTNSRGIFVYHKKNFNTFLQEDQKTEEGNSYYAQCMLDSFSLLCSNGMIFDIANTKSSGYFPFNFSPFALCRDTKNNIYYTSGKYNIRYDLLTRQTHLIKADDAFSTQSYALIDSTVWFGTTRGLGYLRNDSLQWVYKIPFNKDKYSIKCITQDTAGNLWFGTYLQLYRMDARTQTIDSFPLFDNADSRALASIRGNVFIGTYGSGFFVYHQGHFFRMPTGRNNELATTHAFVSDTNGYLWISTNSGLYRTHLDAIDMYLQDTTLLLDYYAYREEDGIRNTEFNGGCSPSYLWLPDGRLSLPTIEGLVMFNPEKTPHYFSADSMIFESIVVDGAKFTPGQTLSIPSSHTNIKIYFAGAWWNSPANEYVYYMLEGFHTQFRLCDINQSAYTIGHLKPGEYTFVLKRRVGFGPQDFIYSRLNFTVLKPWYMETWAYLLYILGFLMVVWLTSVLYARSIRMRNIELQKKVDEQTAKLLNSNIQLEDNLEKLAASELNLRRNIRIRDRLISIITHDILTPLRFIGQIARLGSEEKPEDPGMAKRALTDVQNAVHKLFHSTQNLLHWVSYQQEKFKTVSINCSPFAIVEQLMEDFKEMSRFQDNELINEVPEDDVIQADPNVLSIVLHNLLSNAIKYTQHGRITVRSGSEQKWYILEVSDTGRGMTHAQLEAIRKGTATQGDTTLEDVTAGNGIGLTLVADLMRILRGRWEIDSPEGGGTRVRIFLSIDLPITA